jgi:RHS repeat-associated protein
VYVATDRLGTVRANTQGESFAYYPFGEERTSTVDGRDKFATYFRDTVGQDYAEQRYYNSTMGRFWSPDPGGIKTAVPSRPSSWNRYAYVEGDPINATDRHGLFMCADCPAYGDDDGDDGDDDGDAGWGWSGFSPVSGGSDQSGGGPSGRKVGPPSGAQFTGFNAAYDDLTNPDCAQQIAGTSGASAATLMTDLWNAGVTVSPAGNNADNNNPVNVVVNPNGVNYTYTYQTAYTSNGNIELNGNYFPDPTQQNIQIPGGTMSLLQAVNQALGTNMDATQFGAFVFLHELMHIANAGDNIDTKANNQAIVATCIH